MKNKAKFRRMTKQLGIFIISPTWKNLAMPLLLPSALVGYTDLSLILQV